MLSVLEQAVEELSRFALAHYLIVSNVDSRLSFPAYAGSTLRGGLGRALKQIACQYPDIANCGECLVGHLCAYRLVFEGSHAEVPGSLQFNERPRGYVLRVSSLNGTEYKTGDCFSFQLILVGNVIEYFPYILGALQNLGQTGLGKCRGKFSVAQAYICNARGDIELLYENGKKQPTWPGKGESLSCLFCPAPSIKTLTVTFHTPTRVQSGGQLTDNIPFSLLLRTIVRRVSALNAFYNGVISSVDYPSLFALAESVEIRTSNLHWVDWNRFSSRQETRMKLGGVVGEVTYCGENFSLFWPWLQIASRVHVGKCTTFGLGQISFLWE